MKIIRTVLFALFTLAVMSVAYGEPGSALWTYTNDPGNDSLGYPCTGARTPFPDGSVIGIFWDVQGNGPHDNDPQPPIGQFGDSCNFNTFEFNGQANGMPAGYFFGGQNGNYFVVSDVPTTPPPRYYLRVSHHSPDVCWTSTVKTMSVGPQDWNLTEADWTCVSSACPTVGTVPAAPTGVTATTDELCLAVRVSWTHDGNNETGFHVYSVFRGDTNLAAAAGESFRMATPVVLVDSTVTFFVRAYNGAGESAPSNTTTGRTYLVKFNNDLSTNVHGINLRNTTHTLYVHTPPDTIARCPFEAKIYLLRDTTGNHHGTYFRATPPLIDTIMADTLPILLPDQPWNYCRLLMWDSSLGANVVFTDTTDSIFHLANPAGVTSPFVQIPDHFDLSQNFPNPFNPTTEIVFSVPSASLVHIKVYNIMGQLVRTLAAETYDAGVHRVQWDGKSNNGISVGAGIYIYRMEAKGFTQTKKMLLLK